MLPFNRSMSTIIRRRSHRISITSRYISRIITTSQRNVTIAYRRPRIRIQPASQRTNNSYQYATVSQIRTMNQRMMQRSQQTTSPKSRRSILKFTTRFKRRKLRHHRSHMITAAQTPPGLLIKLRVLNFRQSLNRRAPSDVSLVASYVYNTIGNDPQA